MEAVKILDNVYWVGAIDYSVRDFHGYETNKGSTYNAFLIIDEKVTLIDTVKKEFYPELMSRIASVIDPKKIDQVVSNHAELDHSGALPELMNAIGLEKPVYVTTMGEKALVGQFGQTGINYQVVKTGDSLSLGKLDLNFIETRMVHWPDSMVSFCPQNGILFSQDAFGMHLATTERFDDQVCETVWGYQALKYFANILTLYTTPIAGVLKQIVDSGLIKDIKIICPDHGVIWRTDPGRIVELYAKWVKQEPTRKAVIAFDTMWHSTEAMAHALSDALANHNVQCKLMNLKVSHRSEVATEAYEAGALIFGSPTINNQMYPSVAQLLCYLKGLKFQNKIAGVFGSYGWTGEACKLMTTELESFGFNLPHKAVRRLWAPTEEQHLDPIKELAKAIADNLPKEPVQVTC